jgi:hypothetical protein
VLEDEAARERSAYDEPPFVGHPVMRRTERDEEIRIVSAAVGAGVRVVQIQEGRVPAAGHGAAMLVARDHGAPRRRRDLLRGSRGPRGIHAPDVLRVAHRDLDGDLVDAHMLAARTLRRRATALAHVSATW